MPSNRGRGRRHTHKKKAPDGDRFSPYMASKVCSRCGKQCYSSRDEAKRSAKVNHPGKVMHVYWCEEFPGIIYWHLSSIEAYKLKELRDRERNT